MLNGSLFTTVKTRSFQSNSFYKITQQIKMFQGLFLNNEMKFKFLTLTHRASKTTLQSPDQCCGPPGPASLFMF